MNGSLLSGQELKEIQKGTRRQDSGPDTWRNLLRSEHRTLGGGLDMKLESLMGCRLGRASFCWQKGVTGDFK